MSELTAKRLALLHELVPHAPSIVVLENPKGPSHILLHDPQEVAAPLGVQVTIVAATTKNELDEALTDIAPRRFDAFMVMPDPFLEGHRRELVAFSARNALPAVFAWREFVEAGGLMSYGTNLAGSYRHAGVYVARV